VVLHFEYLNIESGFDFVTVFETNEAGKLLGKFTGSSLPPTVVAAVDTTYVRFKTDGTGQRLGFKARWDTLGCPNACSNRGSCVRDYCYCDEGFFGGDCSDSFCVGTKKYTSIIGNMMDHYRILDEQDKLVLGDYIYKNNVDCRWQLAPLKLFAPYFTLEFLLMDTEIGRDLLIVYDGANQNAPVLAQVSGLNITMPLLSSSSENLFLRFTSDKLKSNLGFFAFWDTMKECGGPIGFCHDGGIANIGPPRLKRGYCYDTQYYPRQHSAKGKCICHYGWYGGDCSFRWCLGAKTLTKRIGEFTDHHDTYETVDGQPNVPVAKIDYKASSFCRWTISPIDPINFIVLTFEYFDLEPGSDFLYVHDGDYFDGSKFLTTYNNEQNTLDGTLTGDGVARMPGQVILSTGNTLFLNFQSDDANTKSHLGFKAKYKGVFCYGRKTMTTKTGQFTDGSPMALRFYPNSYCTWRIKPNNEFFQDHTATLEITVARMNVGLDTVTIYDGEDNTAPILEQFTGQADDITLVTSSGRTLFVEFQSLCHSGPKCRECKKSTLMTGGCDDCLYCNNGRAPKGIGMNLYEHDIPEYEFLNTDCMCDLIPPTNSGFMMTYKVQETTSFCRKVAPMNLTMWHGEFFGFAQARTYRNNEDCSWFIDVDPNLANGYKVEKLNVYMEEMNVDEGRGVGKHPDADLITIYKNHERTTVDCYDECVKPTGAFKWANCPTSLAPQPLRPNCILSQQSGVKIECDRGQIYTYHISCWDSPQQWTVAGGKVRIDFQASSWFVKGNFRFRWEAEVVDPQMSVVSGLGTVTTTAGISAVISLKTRWVDQFGAVQNRTTGGSDVTLVFRYAMLPENMTIFSTATDNQDGSYTMTYIPRFAGVHTLYVQAFGQQVAGSPFTVIVKAGKIDPTKCRAYDTVKTDLTEVGGLTGGKAGRDYFFKVQCEDEFGNVIRSFDGGDDGFPFVTQFKGVHLFFGTGSAAQDGTFNVEYNIPSAGWYEIHIQYKYSPTNNIAIIGSPFLMEVIKVKCPIVGQPACNGQGDCNDDGTCSCDSGWDGEYCQTDLAKWLRMGIVVENAAVGSFAMLVGFSYIWKKCVKEKQLFERLAHDDAEEDW